MPTRQQQSEEFNEFSVSSLTIALQCGSLGKLYAASLVEAYQSGKPQERQKRQSGKSRAVTLATTDLHHHVHLTASETEPGAGPRFQYHKTARDERRFRAVRKWNLWLEDKKILDHALLMQECPWDPDVAAVARYRAELRQCCKASSLLVLTKENTPLGSSIVFEEEGKKLPVNAELLDLLPERSTISDSHHQHCAVVGNSGILQKSRCGQEIDRADLIVRFNLPPMNFSEDVGTKTSLVTLNLNVLDSKFKGLLARRKPFADALRPYRGTLFLIPFFASASHRSVGYRTLYAMEDFALLQQAFFLNPQYRSALDNYWKNEGLLPDCLSSNFMFLSVALELCQRITLYGFWPFLHDLANKLIPGHYYEDTLRHPHAYIKPREFSCYLHMYAQGVLRLRLGKCH
ncbi:alpha-N-acetylneuraminide alpha-2,8-sialyltransferase-like [Rhineura floridana]|uniref:alpha-N-acetylneuraminide alpha-2,8-sialyltransferase-like n=1 Tax=Rhineura floridana TaxID=261503 RepID=UPI002AC83E15|nr:alpha-N-acetylneuraminide alpha-2,8-sialyltransferase-like [Rhineura floridana]